MNMVTRSWRPGKQVLVFLTISLLAFGNLSNAFQVEAGGIRAPTFVDNTTNDMADVPVFEFRPYGPAIDSADLPIETAALASICNPDGADIGAYVASDPPSTAATNTFETLSHRHLCSVSWYQGWSASRRPDFPAQALNKAQYHDGYDTQIVFHLTWEPWAGLSDIASGKYDSYLTRYATQVKNWGGQLRLRFGHEMIQDGVPCWGQPGCEDWYPWQDQPTDYVAAYRHVHDVFTNVGASNVEFVWCANNYPFDLNLVQQYYPGQGYVDWLCMDGYNPTNKDNQPGWPDWLWFDDIFYNIYHTFVDNPGIFGDKPIAIGEMASCEAGRYELPDETKAEWITNAFDRIKSPDYAAVKAFYWFHISKECNWRIHSSSASLSAFQTAIADPYFGSHPPLPFDLIAPAAGEHVLTLRPHFDWSDIDGIGATRYTIQISNNETFTKLVRTGNLASSSYTPPADLPRNATLYWRVQVKGKYGPTDWTPARSLTTPDPPSTPILVAPPSNALLSDDTPLLIWKPVTLPPNTSFQHYLVEVDDDPDFSSVVVNDTSITDPLITQLELAPPLVHNATFFWRVIAVNTAGEMSGWKTQPFRIRVDAPILLAPADGSPVTTPKPAFDWEDATGTIKNYTIQISTVPDFKKLLINASAPGSTYLPLKSLPPGGTLYWRVRANGANGPSDWSLVSVFTTPSCWTQNNSKSTTCAEEDNVNVPVFAEQIDQFKIVATHPLYDVGVDNCAADFSGCNASALGPVIASDTCTTLGDDGTNIVKGCVQPVWWRPYKMKITVGLNSGNFHYLVLYKKIQDEDSWPQILVLYEDGNLRLKPHPPTIGTDTCFGSSVIIGPAAQVTSMRPYADIKMVQVDLATLATDIMYRSGGTAHMSLSVDRAKATAIIDVNYAASASQPFAIFRSMYVTDGNADVDHIQTVYGDFPILDEWTQLGGIDPDGRWWFFHRSTRSIHNTSAPDIKVEILP